MASRSNERIAYSKALMMKGLAPAARARRRNAAVAYAVAIGALVAAVWLRSLLDRWMGDTLPLVTLFGAVAAAV